MIKLSISIGVGGQIAVISLYFGHLAAVNSLFLSMHAQALPLVVQCLMFQHILGQSNYEKPPNRHMHYRGSAHTSGLQGIEFLTHIF